MACCGDVLSTSQNTTEFKTMRCASAVRDIMAGSTGREPHDRMMHKGYSALNSAKRRAAFCVSVIVVGYWISKTDYSHPLQMDSRSLVT